MVKLYVVIIYNMKILTKNNSNFVSLFTGNFNRTTANLNWPEC